MKKCLAFLLVCLLSSQPAWAIPIWQIDRMSSNDQARYSRAMIERLEAVCQQDPVLYAKVKEFFKPHDSLESWYQPNGWDKFLTALSYSERKVVN